jgi:hypothetical protein
MAASSMRAELWIALCEKNTDLGMNVKWLWAWGGEQAAKFSVKLAFTNEPV